MGRGIIIISCTAYLLFFTPLAVFSSAKSSRGSYNSYAAPQLLSPITQDIVLSGKNTLEFKEYPNNLDTIYIDTHIFDIDKIREDYPKFNYVSDLQELKILSWKIFLV